MLQQHRVQPVRAPLGFAPADSSANSGCRAPDLRLFVAEVDAPSHRLRETTQEPEGVRFVIGCSSLYRHFSPLILCLKCTLFANCLVLIRLIY